MTRVRGGVFSGAIVLAGISATLISALLAIGMRQVTHLVARPTPIYMQPASGEVAVPDSDDASSAARPAKPAASANVPVGQPAVSHFVPRHSTAHGGAGTTTGSVTSGGSVAPAPAPANPAQQPATATGSAPASSPSPSASASPSVSASPSASSHGNGNGNGNGNANGNGNGNGNGGNGHHH